MFSICQRDRRVSRLRDGRRLTHGSLQRSDTKPAAATARYSISAPPVLTDLGLARGDGRHLRLDAAARHDLLEILDDRYGRRSTVVTSQSPVDRWHELIGEPRLS
jgi:hypothetical protein